MYQCINGWTKERMKAAIRAGNNGQRAVVTLETGGTSCRYLTPEGNRCAIGCFIPDGHPGQTSRGVVRVLLAEYPDLAEHMPLSAYALALLQDVHDHDRALPGADVHARLFAWIDENVVDAEVPG